MSPSKKDRDYGNMEVIRVGGQVTIREPFGRDAAKLVRELAPTGKNINLMQTTVMRKGEGKRFYI